MQPGTVWSHNNVGDYCVAKRLEFEVDDISFVSFIELKINSSPWGWLVIDNLDYTNLQSWGQISRHNGHIPVLRQNVLVGQNLYNIVEVHEGRVQGMVDGKDVIAMYASGALASDPRFICHILITPKYNLAISGQPIACSSLV